MTPILKRKALVLGGWMFLILGVFGLFLPFLQGILFLLVGLILLAKTQPRFRLLKIRLKKRYPKYAAAFEAAEARAAAFGRGELAKYFGNKPTGKD